MDDRLAAGLSKKRVWRRFLHAAFRLNDPPGWQEHQLMLIWLADVSRCT